MSLLLRRFRQRRRPFRWLLRLDRCKNILSKGNGGGEIVNDFENLRFPLSWPINRPRTKSPTVGGTHDDAKRINQAWEQFLKLNRQPTEAWNMITFLQISVCGYFLAMFAFSATIFGNEVFGGIRWKRPLVAFGAAAAVFAVCAMVAAIAWIATGAFE